MDRSVLAWLIPGMFFTLARCSRDDRSDPGFTYFNDMSEPVAYEYYSQNPNFADGKTAQLPAKGAIPREFVPYAYDKTLNEQKRAGKELVNPVPDTPEQWAAGKEVYKLYCAQCHGDTGRGDGRLVTTKKVKKRVTPLHDDYVQNKPDGEIFHIITLGSVSGFMGSFNWQIKPADRWRLVRFIKGELKGK